MMTSSCRCSLASPSCSPWAADLKSPQDFPSAADHHPLNSAESVHYGGLLTSKLRHHQINGIAFQPAIKGMQHHQWSWPIWLTKPTSSITLDEMDHQKMA